MAKTISKVNVAAAYEKRYRFLADVENDIASIEKVHISVGNSKMGPIPSFSVLPIITCVNCAECSKYCYACKNCFNFNSNILGLAENTALLKADPERVKKAINSFLNSTTTLYRFFRFNVAGDVFNEDYLSLIVSVCNSNPLTTFLVFTKNFNLFNSGAAAGLPSNLHIVFSRWNNTEIYNPNNYPVAIVKTDENTNVPETAFHCSGDCANCLKCFNAKHGEIVYFDLH